ncbi:hypothetical protein Z043_107511 [Scleropages formosus]|uniref:Uncharacterized protein n=1 Tax=Scleropages formosus TaxID=113540 RepID=A0A0P7UU50_SCLFO|nr:hypothetical protein Z043_107511 [Scleropages formosus]
MDGVGDRKAFLKNWMQGVYRRELIILALTSARGSVRQRRLPEGRAQEEEEEEERGGKCPRAPSVRSPSFPQQPGRCAQR